MSVNKERVGLLVAALRSGEFTQVVENLRTTRGHCCLGVATEIALRNGLVIEPDPGQRDSEKWPWGQPYQAMCTPVFQWYGFHSGDPDLNPDGGMTRPASALNDDLGLSFDEIADAFERKYLLDE